ncbi:MAG: hypothetical protein AAF197_01910 [Pseudomonadota bacterium]
MAKAAEKTRIETTVDAVKTAFTARFEEVQNTAKQTFLASLGAYDRSVEEVNAMRVSIDEQISELTQKSTELFNELVERGGKVQADAEVNLKEGRAVIEKELNERLDTIKAKVAELSEQVGVSNGLETVANTLDSVSKRFTKAA